MAYLCSIVYISKLYHRKCKFIHLIEEQFIVRICVNYDDDSHISSHTLIFCNHKTEIYKKNFQKAMSYTHGNGNIVVVVNLGAFHYSPERENRTIFISTAVFVVQTSLQIRAILTIQNIPSETNKYSNCNCKTMFV